MPASRNSKLSRISSALLVLGILAAVSAASLQWVSSRGYTLYYGDAEAHLNIARRILDSRTPGYEQIGTVWLPLPHLLMLPWVGNDGWWRSGMAGSLPAAACFTAGAWLFFLALRRMLDSAWAAAGGTAALALNPNMLYLQAAPMTEAVFLACVAGLLYFLVLHAQSSSVLPAAAAGLMALCGAMTRYEGWFLLPFAAAILLFTGGKRRWRSCALFSVIAGAGPLFWLAHNWWLYGDPLEFYRGSWSARAIYQRALESGMQRYPGDGHWLMAMRYYAEAVRLCAGWPLAVLGLFGLAGWRKGRCRWAPLFLLLPPVFYVWSMHSSATPVFVPHLWPHSYYNTRYGLAAFPLLGAGLAGLVRWIPERRRWLGAVTAMLLVATPWLWRPAPEKWICWKESEVNSRARRAWTAGAAEFLKRNYRGGGILISFGDIAGVFRHAGIPLHHALHEGNRPLWDATIARPDLFLRDRWAIAFAGDKVSAAIMSANRKSFSAAATAAPAQGDKAGNRPSMPTAIPGRLNFRYQCVKIIVEKNSPVVELYQRLP